MSNSSFFVTTAGLRNMRGMSIVSNMLSCLMA
jgi:hypothetical protein